MKTTITPEQERQTKQDKFFDYLHDFMEIVENSELINLTQIHRDYGSPRYDSPKRILHYPSGKALIQHEIQRNNMCVENVIRYEDNTVYGNFNLALEYLISIDAFCKYCYYDFLMKSEPDILEKYLKP
jgi:hypothetical protein